jgi:hypothetical protein
MSIPFVRLDARKYLFAEGVGPKLFFQVWLSRLGKTDVEVLDFGGVSELPGKLQRIATDPLFRATGLSLAIVRDAEKDARGAFQSVCHSLTRYGLPPPGSPGIWTESKPSVGVFVLPDNVRPGMIETLCAESLGENPLGETSLAHADTFLDQVSAAGHPTSNRTKARLHATLAAWDLPDPRVGAAARAKAFDWNAAAFSPLAKFLDGL